jgi:hypothetical protein
MTAAGTSPFFSHRLMVGAILLGGVAGGLFSYQQGRASERERAGAEFANRASVRHALTREILGHYEDALFGLSAAFMVDPDVTREEFARSFRVDSPRAACGTSRLRGEAQAGAGCAGNRVHRIR